MNKVTFKPWVKKGVKRTLIVTVILLYGAICFVGAKYVFGMDKRIAQLEAKPIYIKEVVKVMPATPSATVTPKTFKKFTATPSATSKQ